MTEITAGDITETVSRLSQEACYHLPEDVLATLEKAREKEESPAARNALEIILKSLLRENSLCARIPGPR